MVVPETLAGIIDLFFYCQTWLAKIIASSPILIQHYERVVTIVRFDEPVGVGIPDVRFTDNL
jgi:hypothetical protein